MTRGWVLGGVLWVLSGALGCGAEGDAPRGVPTFFGAPTVVVPSASGRLTIEVWVWPAPLVKGLDAAQYRIVDAAGHPMSNGRVSVTPWMPSHGHGTSVAPSVTARGDGLYEIDRVLFFMEGRWELRSEIVGAKDADLGVADTFVSAGVVLSNGAALGLFATGTRQTAARDQMGAIIADSALGLVTFGAGAALPIASRWRAQGIASLDCPIRGLGQNETAGVGLGVSVLRVWP